MDSENERVDEDQPGAEGGQQHPSRGDFIKWGTVALGGMYVGPKVTSFAVNKSMGHAGSPAPTPPTPPSPPTYTTLPPTGGAAAVQTTGSTGSGVPAWVPAAGVAAVGAGLYAKKHAQSQPATVTNDDAKETH